MIIDQAINSKDHLVFSSQGWVKKPVLKVALVQPRISKQSIPKSSILPKRFGPPFHCQFCRRNNHSTIDCRGMRSARIKPDFSWDEMFSACKNDEQRYAIKHAYYSWMKRLSKTQKAYFFSQHSKPTFRTEISDCKRHNPAPNGAVLAACKCSPTVQGESEDVKQTNRPHLDVPAITQASRRRSQLAPGIPANRGGLTAPAFNESLSAPVTLTAEASTNKVANPVVSPLLLH